MLNFLYIVKAYMAPELLLEGLPRSPLDHTAPFYQMPSNSSTSLAPIVQKEVDYLLVILSSKQLSHQGVGHTLPKT